MAKLSKRSRCKSKKLTVAAKLYASGKLRIPHPDDPEPAKKYDEALAALGLYLEAEEEIEETFALWNECVDTFNFWLKIQTQWVKDLNGRQEGLNYPAIDVVMNWEGIPKKRRQALSNELRAMEIAVINQSREQE